MLLGAEYICQVEPLLQMHRMQSLFHTQAHIKPSVMAKSQMRGGGRELNKCDSVCVYERYGKAGKMCVFKYRCIQFLMAGRFCGTIFQQKHIL